MIKLYWCDLMIEIMWSNEPLTEFWFEIQIA